MSNPRGLDRRHLLAGACALASARAFGASEECGEPRIFINAGDKTKSPRRDSTAVKQFYAADRWDLGDLAPYAPATKVSGLIRMWGSNYVKWSGLIDAWEKEFQKFHPEVRFEYQLRNALFTVPSLAFGAAEVSPGRQATWSEILLFENMFGYDPLEIPMATGSFEVPGWTPAFGIFVHKDNPLRSLTMPQLDGIFGTARTGAYHGTEWHPEAARGAEKNIRTWGQLGLTGAWKDRPIQVYAMNLRLTAVRNFELKVLQGSAKWNESLKEYANCVRTDGTFARAEYEPMRRLNADPCGITYGGLALENTKALPIAPDASAAPVPYDIENVRARRYPLFTEMFFYANRKPGTPLNPLVREYLTYILSREGQQTVARDGKYLPLTGAVARAGLARLG